MSEIECFFCRAKAEAETIRNNLPERIFVDCPVCGQYAYTASAALNESPCIPKDKNKLISYLYYNGRLAHSILKQDDFCNFIGTDEEYKLRHEIDVNCTHVTDDVVNNWYPNSFSKKISFILNGLSYRSDVFGSVIYLTIDEAAACFFLKRYEPNGEIADNKNVQNQIRYIADYLNQNELVKIDILSITNEFPVRLSLSPKGWQRVDESQRTYENGKNVFVSMAFRESTKETREAIRRGIIASGFSPEFMDEIIHNQQIVPEMFRLIRECRFLILEISEPNYGAYYEAGYALGLGKEVIITCSSEIFNKKYETEEEKKYERYLKPHFDIVQKQVLVWNDHDDLTKKLSEWIKSIII